MVLPAFSERFASSVAANIAAPDDIPTRRPSALAISFPSAKASSLLTVIISS